MTEEMGSKSSFSLDSISLRKPEEIKNFLDQYVIGRTGQRRFSPLLYTTITRG